MKWFIKLVSSVIAKVVVGALLVVFAISTTQVNHDEAVILTSFGKHPTNVMSPGLHLVFPFINDVRRYPTTSQQLIVDYKSIWSANDPEGETDFLDGIDVVFESGGSGKVIVHLSYSIIIKDSQEALNNFVETFGRETTESATISMKRHIADKVRDLTTAVLSSVSLSTAERQNIRLSRLIQDLANTGTVPEPLGNDVTKELSSVLPDNHLTKIGIVIETLGYRVKPADEIATERIASAAALEAAKNKRTLAEARLGAIAAEHKLALEASELFQRLPPSDPERLRVSALQKWDGRLPLVNHHGDTNSPYLDLIGLAVTREDTPSARSAVKP